MTEFPSPISPPEVVLRFLESVGRRSEAEFYLSLFRAEPKEQFAAISVDANVARHATEAVVLHLRFLANLGLTPLVVLGLFEPTDAPDHAARIVKKLVKAGVAAELVADDATAIARAARAGTLPVLAYAPENGDASPPRAAAAVDARFARLGALLSGLSTRKLLFLHRPGGLRQRATLVPLVNLSADVPSLLASRELSRKERAMVIQSRRLVEELVPHKLLVAVTSPLNLFRELFTVKGAGTLLRRGAALTRHPSLAGLDRERLRALLASAFGRPPVDEFFDRPVSQVYLVDGYRGAAVLLNTPLGAYLSKFAVDREAQGEGLGRDLWDQLAADHPKVYWRARAANPICEWYGKLADGLHKSGEWIVFWRGLPPQSLAEAIAWTLDQPVDIPPRGAEGA
jgi:acetylglutamate kinase